MSQSFTGRKRIRKEFGRIQAAADMPNLIEVQKTSYDKFLQMDVEAEDLDVVSPDRVAGLRDDRRHVAAAPACISGHPPKPQVSAILTRRPFGSCVKPS